MLRTMVSCGRRWQLGKALSVRNALMEVVIACFWGLNNADMRKFLNIYYFNILRKGIHC